MFTELVERSMSISMMFPLFFNLTGKKILVVGGGNIACRRIKALLPFGCRIFVVAPEVLDEIEIMSNQDVIILEKRPYVEQDLEDSFLCLACTNDIILNSTICKMAKEQQILVNNCSCKEECDFYFPGIACKDEVTVGVTAGGTNHKLARKMTDEIRKLLDGIGVQDNETEKDNSR